MKKAVAAVLALVIVLSTFAGCSVSDIKNIRSVEDAKAFIQSFPADKIKAYAVNIAGDLKEKMKKDMPEVAVAAAEEKEKSAYSWNDSYLETVKIYQSRYGEFKEKYKADDKNGTTLTFRSGLFFAELFDWNIDGVPEMILGYAEEGEKGEEVVNISNLEIYTYDGTLAKPVLLEQPGSRFDSSDRVNKVKFIRNSDGSFTVEVAHTYGKNNEKNDYRFYTYDGSEVKCTEYWFGTVPFDTEISAPEKETHVTAAESTEKSTAAQAGESTTADGETTAEEASGEETTASEETTAAEESTTEAETTETEVTTVRKSAKRLIAEPDGKSKVGGKFKYFRINGEGCSEEEFRQKFNAEYSDNITALRCDKGGDIDTVKTFLEGSNGDYTDPLSGETFIAHSSK